MYMYHHENCNSGLDANLISINILKNSLVVRNFGLTEIVHDNKLQSSVLYARFKVRTQYRVMLITVPALPMGITTHSIIQYLAR